MFQHLGAAAASRQPSDVLKHASPTSPVGELYLSGASTEVALCTDSRPQPRSTECTPKSSTRRMGRPVTFVHDEALASRCRAYYGDEDRA